MTMRFHSTKPRSTTSVLNTRQILCRVFIVTFIVWYIPFNWSSSIPESDLKFTHDVRPKTFPNLEALRSKEGSIPHLSTFSYTLFSELSQTYKSKPNILVSPFSIASALTLILSGASDGSTCQAQLQSTLNVQSHLDMAVLSKMLQESLDKPLNQGFVELNLANGAWLKGDAILESWQNMVDTVHKAKAEALPATYDPINEFVESKTNGMIKGMLQGQMDPLTVAILVNAVYFKGMWREKFESEHTTKGLFFAMGKDGVGVWRSANYMFAEREMHAALGIDELNGADMVRLDYGRSMQHESDDDEQWMPEEEVEFSAFFILPPRDSKDGLNGIFVKLAELSKPQSGDQGSSKHLPIHKVLSRAWRREIELYLPRFRLSYGTESISQQLQTLGILDAFHESNMFNAMSKDPEVHLDNVFHNAVMEVTEEGTVAAAETAGRMRSTSDQLPPEVVRFDRPFGVLVVHRSKDLLTPLFIGRVDDPEFDF